MELIEIEVKRHYNSERSSCRTEKVENKHIKPDTYRKSVSIDFVSDGFWCRLTTAVIKLQIKHVLMYISSTIRVSLNKLCLKLDREINNTSKHVYICK